MFTILVTGGNTLVSLYVKDIQGTTTFSQANALKFGNAEQARELAMTLEKKLNPYKTCGLTTSRHCVVVKDFRNI